MRSNNIPPKAYNFIDLFAGAGGLSEGFLQAGYIPVAHVEKNKFAAKTLETRSAYYYLKYTNNLGIYKKYRMKPCRLFLRLLMG